MSDIHKLTIQTRRPRGDDAVWLCDEDGVKTGDKQDLRPGLDPKVAAINLLRGKVDKRKSDFNRPLRYPKNFY